jgi:tRNA (guanine-N7-)-methyltransferase
MPHIKVAPFSTSRLDRLIKEGSVFSFHACASDASSQLHKEELLGIEFEGEAFVLEIHKREQAFLIKPDKPTRPLDVNRIKRALAYLADKADLDIVHDNIAFSPTKPALADAFNKRIEDFEEPDFGGRNLVIEVGFGSGRHLLHQAKEHPDVLHIGIEIHTPSAQQVLKQIELQGLTNVWVVNYDARLLLEMIPSNAAKAVYVHFPVPWDKKPHRRVISDAFVAEALRVLNPGGYLELRTDSDRYYTYALEVFSRPAVARFDVTKNHAAAIRSKYEDRWQRQAKDIYTLRLYCDEDSEAILNVPPFVFDRPLKSLASLLELSDEAILKSDHFVHFERRYRMVSEEGVLIKCSFGSFDRPEHKLIAIRDGRAAYYPQRPVRSSTNAKAHQTIGESIYA